MGVLLVSQAKGWLNDLGGGHDWVHRDKHTHKYSHGQMALGTQSGGKLWPKTPLKFAYDLILSALILNMNAGKGHKRALGSSVCTVQYEETTKMCCFPRNWTCFLKSVNIMHEDPVGSKIGRSFNSLHDLSFHSHLLAHCAKYCFCSV